MLKHAIKTSIAAILTVLIYQYFNLPNGYWAVITCIVIMQSNIDSGSLELTIRLALQRLIGTTSGAVVGLALIYLIGPSYVWLLILIAILIILGSYLTLLYRGFNLFGPTAIIIILLSHQGPLTESIAFYRTIEIILGVVIAIVVTISLWPYRLSDQLKSNYKRRGEALKKQFSGLLEMLPVGTISKEWLENNMKLTQKINADQQYLRHLAGLKGELREQVLLACKAEKQLMIELKNFGVSIPGMPTSFLEAKELLNVCSDNIQAVVETLGIFIRCDNYEQIKQTVNDLALHRNNMLEVVNKFRQERKATSKEVYSLSESYAVFLFIQAILSCLDICEELIHGQPEFTVNER